MIKKEQEDELELSYGQRFPRKETTYKDFEDSEPAPKTRRESFNDKFIKGERGKLIRRGSPTAQRAENREAARNRAKKAALKRKNK